MTLVRKLKKSTSAKVRRQRANIRVQSKDYVTWLFSRLKALLNFRHNQGILLRHILFLAGISFQVVQLQRFSGFRTHAFPISHANRLLNATAMRPPI